MDFLKTDYLEQILRTASERIENEFSFSKSDFTSFHIMNALLVQHIFDINETSLLISLPTKEQQGSILPITVLLPVLKCFLYNTNVGTSISTGDVIIPTGVQALNKLGLSTQIPLKVVFLTDGAARSVKIGKRTITFKKTSPKNLMVKGEISGLAIQALKSIGQNKIEDDVLIKMLAILKKEKKENILHDAKLAPAWINKILMSATK